MKTKNEILEFLKKEQNERIGVVKAKRKEWIKLCSDKTHYMFNSLELSIEPNNDRQQILNQEIERYKDIIADNQQTIKYIDYLIRHIDY